MPDLERLPASSLSSSSLVDAVCALRLLRPRAGDLMISVFMRRLAALVRPQECSAPQLVDILHAFYSLRHQGLRNGTVLELSFRRILDGHNVRTCPCPHLRAVLCCPQRRTVPCRAVLCRVYDAAFEQSTEYASEVTLPPGGFPPRIPQRAL
jgi:hypothetical protein